MPRPVMNGHAVERKPATPPPAECADRPIPTKTTTTTRSRRMLGRRTDRNITGTCHGRRITENIGETRRTDAAVHRIENTGPDRRYAVTTMRPDAGFSAFVEGGSRGVEQRAPPGRAQSLDARPYAGAARTRRP
jgi:hypothetical protein